MTPNGIEPGRIDDGHVVAGADGRRADARAGAPADVGLALQNLVAQRHDQLLAPQVMQQVEGVAAVDQDGIALGQRRHGSLK